MIHLSDVSKAFGPQVLFANVNLHIGPEDRIGLVGPNGSGKTTLFEIIEGHAGSDRGDVRRRKGLRIGYLRQEMSTRDGGILIRDVIDSVRGLKALEEEKKRLEEAMKDAPAEEAEALAKRHGEVEDRFSHLGGYQIEAEAREILHGLGFGDEDLRRPLRSFSGGWHMRIQLAKILLNHPDLLLLDEPTNHLDLESIRWLESYLLGFRGAYLIVAHDRTFLNRTIRRIIEVRQSGIREYPGDYDRYRVLQAEQEDLDVKRYNEQQARIRELEDFIARNRVRKDRARIVQGRIKQLEKIERLELPRRRKNLRFRFPAPPRSGNVVINLEGICKKYGKNEVFAGIDLSVLRGERIAVLGVNGAGKSTLLKILAGAVETDGGAKTIGTNVSYQYFAQHQLEALNPHNTVLKEIQSVADYETMPSVRGILGAFLFSGDEVDKPVDVLSGGEKSRLALAKMMLRRANLLVMDEPTNHLDIASREVLEGALRTYEGTLVFTSHDRSFIDTLASKVILVRDGRLHHYLGNYSDFEWKVGQESKEKERGAGAEGPETESTSRDRKREQKRLEAKRRNVLYRALKPLKKELEKIEARVSKGEARLEALETVLQDPSLAANTARLYELAGEHTDVKSDLEDAYRRWMKVTEGIEEIQAAHEKDDEETGES
ncbi:ABC-F family ATP-binding cassette domain-containing protein [Thermodesulfobacteriota bacterium]